MRIILFGSHARGDAREDSDIDLLVIEQQVEDRTREMVRLRRLLRPLRIPADILVYSAHEVARGETNLGRRFTRLCAKAPSCMADANVAELLLAAAKRFRIGWTNSPMRSRRAMA